MSIAQLIILFSPLAGLLMLGVAKEEFKKPFSRSWKIDWFCYTTFWFVLVLVGSIADKAFDFLTTIG